MITPISDALNKALAIASEQSNRLMSEINSDYNLRNAALTAFTENMREVHELRARADQVEAAAIRDLDTALTNSASIALALMQQIQSGQIVTGSPAKPRLAGGQ